MIFPHSLRAQSEVMNTQSRFSLIVRDASGTFTGTHSMSFAASVS